MVGPYHPFLTVWILFNDWEGHNSFDPTEKIDKGIYDRGHPESWAMRQVYPAHYLGVGSPRLFDGKLQFFETTVGADGWKNPEADLARRFSLQIHRK
jgi:hypothetical protein